MAATRPIPMIYPDLNQGLSYFLFKKKIPNSPSEKRILEPSPVAIFYVHHPIRNEKLVQGTDFGNPSLNIE